MKYLEIVFDSSRILLEVIGLLTIAAAVAAWLDGGLW